MAECPSCNHLLPPRATFCLYCGEPVDKDVADKLQADAPKESDQNLCPECGKSHPFSMKFCVHCGALMDPPKGIPIRSSAKQGDNKPAPSPSSKSIPLGKSISERVVNPAKKKAAPAPGSRKARGRVQSMSVTEKKTAEFYKDMFSSDRRKHDELIKFVDTKKRKERNTKNSGCGCLVIFLIVIAFGAGGLLISLVN